MKTKRSSTRATASRSRSGFTKAVFDKFYREFATKDSTRDLNAAGYIRELRSK